MKTSPATKTVKRAIKFRKNRWRSGGTYSDAAILHAAHECANRYDATIIRTVMKENSITNAFTTCKIVFSCERDKWSSLVTLFLSVVKDGIQDVSYNN